MASLLSNNGALLARAVDALYVLLQAAAAAAEQAQQAAESSAVQALQAQQAAQGVARALLASKRAEIEAADMLEKPKNPKDADPAAADLLKVPLSMHALSK